MFDLHGRVAVVTGASSGLGAHYAEVLAREGADVVICARRVDKLAETAEKCRAYGREVLAVPCDVTSLESVQALVKATMDKFGKEMIKAGYDRIINIGSSLACGGSMDMAISDYGTAKGGVVNFTRCAGAEWAKTGVTVNCMCPGFHESGANTPEAMEAMGPMIANRTPIGRAGEHSELDSTLVYLAAEESGYIIGAIIHCDGGWSCI